MLCSFSRIIIVGFPLGPMIYLRYGFHLMVWAFLKVVRYSHNICICGTIALVYSTDKSLLEVTEFVTG